MHSSNCHTKSYMYILVVNQATYVSVIIEYYWVPAGFECVCLLLCFFGFCSMTFLLTTQVMSIARGGTQYFPGNQPGSIRNLIKFFVSHSIIPPPVDTV